LVTAKAKINKKWWFFLKENWGFFKILKIGLANFANF